MIIGKPAPFVRAFVEAVDAAIRAHQPSHGMSAMPRTWLAFCVTAVLVTHSICWARFERASLGTYSLAALSWMFRHSKIPWDDLLVASVRVILRHYGITSGSLVIDDTDTQRSKSAHTLAHLYKLRDKESGGYLWGQSLVFLVLVTPKISIPVGFTFYQPAPELSAWYRQEKALKKQGVSKQQRPPNPPLIRSIPPNNNSPCACWSASRGNIRASECIVSWRMRSMAPPPLSMVPRPFSAGCTSSRKRVAIRTSACISATSTSPTILPPIPGHRRPSASGAVTRGS